MRSGGLIDDTKRALVLIALLLGAAAPVPTVRAVRSLLQDGGRCQDLVPGGEETAVEVPAGETVTLAAYQNVGAAYLVGSAEDGGSPQGSSIFQLELWLYESPESGGSYQLAAATSDSGCATTSVADVCPSPATVLVRVLCLNSAEPCRVLVAAYLSACADAAQPAATAVPAGADADSGTGSGTSASPAEPASSSSPSGSSGGDGGLSSTTWIIIGASVGAAALLALALRCLCCCKRRRRRPTQPDLEAGTYHHQQPDTHGKQQQFLVAGAAGPAWPAALAAAAPGDGAPAQQEQAWAFAYKVPAQRLTFATHSGRGSALLQRWESIDGWLAAQLGGTMPVPQGCLMYNNEPPEKRPDGSPTGYQQPIAYETCGHAKGLVLWDRRRVVWLVHSVPKWPCHDPSARNGVGGGGLPVIEHSQTKQGQSFLWAALPRERLAAVLRQVAHMQGLVYFASDTGIWPHQPKDYSKMPGLGFSHVQLSAGLWHLAKANEAGPGFSGDFNFYEELARRCGGRWLLRTNLTQNQGPEAQCPSTPILENVSTLRVPGFDHAPYMAGSEHAKLAVCVGMRRSTNPPSPLVLVGDLNNTRPQWRRGGGGLLVQHQHLSEALRLMLDEDG